jgi:hypothetical protein
VSALWPLQKAIVQRLKADAALMGRVSGIHDGEVPQGAAALPYVVIGAPTEAPAGVLGPRGWSDTLTLHVWSGYDGRKEALEIVALIDAALASPLTLDGHTSARLRQEFLTVLVEDDGVRHAPVRYRAFTFEVQ